MRKVGESIRDVIPREAHRVLFMYQACGLKLSLAKAPTKKERERLGIQQNDYFNIAIDQCEICKKDPWDIVNGDVPVTCALCLTTIHVGCSAQL